MKTNTEIRTEYVVPTLPKVLTDPCKDVEMSFATNGELLMSYIDLQSAYLECSAKVNSIRAVLQSYYDVYATDPVEQP